MKSKNRILVTGGKGFLGGHLLEELSDKGYSDVFAPGSEEFDLRNREDCNKVVEKVDIVIHLAALIGGIGFINNHPGEVYYNNLIMGAELMEAARKAGVEKFVGIGTVCSYPKSPPIPFSEEDLWEGYPEETTAPYGWAKKMLIVQAEAYKKQYGFNAINLLPVNLYGPRDNFTKESAHVIPALIRRFVEAREADLGSVTVWGSGKATREFLYVKDAAIGIVMAMEGYNSTEPVNLGSGREISIKEVVELIKEYTGYGGEIVWDKSKPDGQPRRCLDVSRAEQEFGFNAQTGFEKGLKKTIVWYENGSVSKK